MLCQMIDIFVCYCERSRPNMMATYSVMSAIFWLSVLCGGIVSPSHFPTCVKESVLEIFRYILSLLCMQASHLLLQRTFCWELPLGSKLPWPHPPGFAANAPLRMMAASQGPASCARRPNQNAEQWLLCLLLVRRRPTMTTTATTLSVKACQMR